MCGHSPELKNVDHTSTNSSRAPGPGGTLKKAAVSTNRFRLICAVYYVAFAMSVCVWITFSALMLPGVANRDPHDIPAPSETYPADTPAIV